MPKFNLGWLKDKNGEKFAPKTLIKQVISEIGENLQDILDRKITTPTSASVGQILEVKEVDENGKPTEWKAVDKSTGSGGATPDWNQNDENAPDYIKNRPFWTGEEITLFDDVIDITEGCCELIDYGFDIKVGMTYKVKFDGMFYEVVGRSAYNYKYIGLENEEITEEVPFIYYDDGWFYTDKEDGQYTLSIKCNEIHEIDDKYLPGDIVRKDMFNENTVEMYDLWKIFRNCGLEECSIFDYDNVYTINLSVENWEKFTTIIGVVSVDALPCCEGGDFALVSSSGYNVMLYKNNFDLFNGAYVNSFKTTLSYDEDEEIVTVTHESKQYSLTEINY